MAEHITWREAAVVLRSHGWTVEYKPLVGEYMEEWRGLPYLWRSPDGLSGWEYRSSHPDAPPEAVMQAAHKAGIVNFTHLTIGAGSE